MTYTVVEQCRTLVKEVYTQFDASHDFEHILRVEQNALTIARGYAQVNIETLLLAVYLHDVSDAKYASNTATLENILSALALEQQQLAEIRHIIEAISFSGGNEIEARSIEAQIARDADRLDAIGAIGIARAFTYGGAKGRKLYDDAENVRHQMTKEQYHHKQSATVTHFYEKLLRIKDLMCTPTGKQLAEQRHDFMLQYLTQLAKEREGLQ